MRKAMRNEGMGNAFYIESVSLSKRNLRCDSTSPQVFTRVIGYS